MSDNWKNILPIVRMCTRCGTDLSKYTYKLQIYAIILNVVHRMKNHYQNEMHANEKHKFYKSHHKKSQF